MRVTNALAAAAVVLSAGTALAEDRAHSSAIVIGKSSFGARCALCHGADGKGGGDIAEMFQTPPSDLTTLSERSGGTFPFATVYETIVNGMGERAHGSSEMPIWGDYFMSDSLADRGVNAADAVHIAQGRILSLVYYLESIQE